MEKLHYLSLHLSIYTQICVCMYTVYTSRTPCPEKVPICLIFNLPWLLAVILTTTAIINKLLIRNKDISLLQGAFLSSSVWGSQGPACLIMKAWLRARVVYIDPPMARACCGAILTLSRVTRIRPRVPLGKRKLAVSPLPPGRGRIFTACCSEISEDTMNPRSLALAVSRGCLQTFRRPSLLLPAAPVQVSIRTSQQPAEAVRDG